jgi:hypothetical protein
VALLGEFRPVASIRWNMAAESERAFRERINDYVEACNKFAWTAGAAPFATKPRDEHF